jgi:hypothetical protein
MSAGIFINYRRHDTIATAGRLFDRLALAFGNKQVFMDVEHIPAGADFTLHIEAELTKCGVLLALIGPHWLDIRDNFGSRRLLDANDLVAKEIEVALHRGLNVIPVLVDGAAVPKLEDLPDALKPLVRRNAVELRNAQFGVDVDQLVVRISELLNRRTTAARHRFIEFGGVLFLVCIISLGSLFLPIADLWRTGLGWLGLAKRINSVEECGLVGDVKAELEFSGTFTGIIADSPENAAEVQLKLVREKDTVKGSYFRAGICGSVAGEVVGNQMIFRWRWADGSGRGVATQAGYILSGTSGFRDAVDGGGKFTLALRRGSELRLVLSRRS